MWSKLWILGFILLAVKAEATLQYVYVTDTVDQFGNQWTIKGSGDQITVLNDGVDANYIFSKNVADSIRYVIQHIATYDEQHADIIDSAVVHLWAQDFQVGVTSDMRVGCAINTDITWATTIVIDNQTFGAVSTSHFLTPPGSRGTWDKWELDSADIIFNPVTITGDSLAITACTVFVFTSLAVPSRMYFTNDTSNCTAGSNFSKEMEFRKASILDTIKIQVPALTTENDYFFTPELSPANTAWGTSGFTVRLNVIKQVNPDSLRLRISRTDNVCAVIESTPYTTRTSISGTGEKSVVIPPYTFANGSGNNRMRLEFEWYNQVAALEDSIWFTVGVNESRLDMDISDNDPNKSGVACAVLEDTLRVQDTTANMQQWGNYNAYGFQHRIGTDSGIFQITAFQQSYGASRVAKVSSMRDRIFGTAIFEQTQADSQRYTLENTMITGAETIQSINAYVYARRKNGAGGVAFLRMRLMENGSDVNFCESGDLSLTTQYALYTFQFTGTPSGAGSCADAMTPTNLDNLEITFMADSVLTNDTIYVGQFDMYVCYTTGGAPVPKRRKRMLQATSAKRDEEGILVLTENQPYFTVPIWGKDD